MGFSLLAEGVLRAHLPDAPWRPLVAKLGYAVGFLTRERRQRCVPHGWIFAGLADP